MSIARRITRDGTLHKWAPGPVDTSNDAGEVFTDLPVKCEVQQSSGFDVRTGESVGVGVNLALFRARVPEPDVGPEVQLTKDDELSVDGVRYTFDGPPWHVRHPRTGRFSHWEARLGSVT